MRSAQDPPDPDNLPGWMDDVDRAYLRDFVLRERPRTIIEIGAHAGRSTVVLAEALREVTPAGGILWAVDPWHWSPDGARIALLFLRALILHRVVDLVRPVAMGSVQFSKTWAEWYSKAPGAGPIDLVFIDGDHRPAAVAADLEAWAPLSRHVLVHDWALQPVREAATAYAAKLGQVAAPIPATSNLWHLRQESKIVSP
jgi:predicted O-methyltransferase YrrM